VDGRPTHSHLPIPDSQRGFSMTRRSGKQEGLPAPKPEGLIGSGTRRLAHLLLAHLLLAHLLLAHLNVQKFLDHR
jgi:hypothetical protein